MKSFIAKRTKSILVTLRYLRFKKLKYKENNKNICNTFDHNFKNITLSIMRKVLFCIIIIVIIVIYFEFVTGLILKIIGF